MVGVVAGVDRGGSGCRGGAEGTTARSKGPLRYRSWASESSRLARCQGVAVEAGDSRWFTCREKGKGGWHLKCQQEPWSQTHVGQMEAGN